jgi:hypothetical protein
MEPLLTRIDNEVAAGRPWRAKEIIRGTIGNTWPDAAVVERYGRILLRTGDDVEAGKYLWLSGVRRAEYEPAVALFLRRHGRHGREILLAQMPKSFRRIPFDQLPPEVRGELTKYDIGSGDFGRNRRSPGDPPAPRRWTNALIAALAFGFLVCVLVGAAVGFQIIVRWVRRALW